MHLPPTLQLCNPLIEESIYDAFIERAIAIANDTLYGLGAGVWTRDMHQAYQEALEPVTFGLARCE